MELAEHAVEDALSPVEVRVLRLIAEGNSNKDIAAQLSLTEDAVKGQVRSILAKLFRQDFQFREADWRTWWGAKKGRYTDED